MSSTNAAAPISSQNMSVARSLTAARNGASVIAYCAAFAYASGCSRHMFAEIRSISSRARSTVASGASRAKTSVMRCVADVTIVALR